MTHLNRLGVHGPVQLTPVTAGPPREVDVATDGVGARPVALGRHEWGGLLIGIRVFVRIEFGSWLCSLKERY